MAPLTTTDRTAGARRRGAVPTHCAAAGTSTAHVSMRAQPAPWRAFVGPLLIAACLVSRLLVPSDTRRALQESPPSAKTCAAVANRRGPRLVAVGDVHGDFEALADVLSAARIANASCGGWTGGDSILVQMGDVADRGRDVAKANACLRRLQRLAPEVGGRVIRLVGNHELMRAEGSLRDAHPAESSAAAVAGVMQWKVDVKSGAVRASYSDGPYFFTHAGVRPALLERLPTSSIGELVGYLNDRLRDAVVECHDNPVRGRYLERACRFKDDIFTAGIDRGGRGVGGTFWTDWRILEGSPAEALPDAVQIVGHSAARCRPRRGSPCEPIRFRSDLRAVVIDAGLSKAYASNRAYLEIDGSIYAHWLEADSSVWRRRDLAGPCDIASGSNK